MKKVKAFIFDLDGVITDTADYHYRAWKELADSLHIHIDRTFNEQLKGISRLDSLETILKYGNKQNQYSDEEKLRLTERKNNYYLELIKDISPKDYLPGIKRLLEAIKQKGYRIGLASASRNAPSIIDALDANKYIEYIVNPLAVKQGKPAPDLFLNVAKYFNVFPEECIGIEDSQSGIKAINHANMFSVGIGLEHDLSEANLIFNKTSDMNLNHILYQFKNH